MPIINKSIINNLPSKHDFYIDESSYKNFDIQYAVDKYYGKDIEYVKKCYCKISSYEVLDDIRYIGINAFLYYILALFDYIMDISVASPKGVDNYDTICALLEVLNEKILSNPNATKRIFSQIENFSQWIIDNESEMNSDYIECDDLKLRYGQLLLMVRKYESLGEHRA